jgi:hypothetical protein
LLTDLQLLRLLVPLTQGIDNQFSTLRPSGGPNTAKLSYILCVGRDKLRDVSSDGYKSERLRLDLATATMRRDWAKLEADRNGVTPALTKFIEEAGRECDDLTGKLAKIPLS